MTADKKKRLGEMLIEAKLISQEQLDMALEKQKEWGDRLGSVLINMGYLTEDQLLAFLRNFYNVPSVDLTRYKIKEEIIKLIPEEVAKKYGLIPVGFKDIKGKKTMVVAMKDPTDIQALDEVRVLIGHAVQPTLTVDFTLQRALRHYYDRVGILVEEEPVMQEGLYADPSQMIADKIIVEERRKKPSAKDELVTQVSNLRSQMDSLTQALIKKGLISRSDLKSK